MRRNLFRLFIGLDRYFARADSCNFVVPLGGIGVDVESVHPIRKPQTTKARTMSYPGDEMYCTHCREFTDHMTAECPKAKEPMWCAFCGKWSDHSSGSCPDWKEEAKIFHTFSKTKTEEK